MVFLLSVFSGWQLAVGGWWLVAAGDLLPAASGQ